MDGRNRILIAGLGVLFAGQVRADVPAANLTDTSTLLGARSSARGGATVAASTTHDALLQNPAGGAFNQKYAVTLGYSGVGDGLSASIVDTKSGPIGGGVFYLKRDLREAREAIPSVGDYARVEERAGFSFFGRPAEGFGLGVNAKYSYRRSFDSRPEFGTTKNWNADIGGKYLLNNQVTLGVVAQNMLEDTSGLNPKTLAVGVEGSVVSGLSLSAQLSKLIVKGLSRDLSWSAGGEYAFGNGVAVRLGYTDLLPWSQRIIGAGLGYETKSFGIDYALQASSGSGVARGAVLHSVSLSGFL